MERTTSLDATEPATDNIPGVEVANGEDAAVEFASWDKDANIHLRLLHARADAKRMEKKGKHEIRKDGKKVGEFGFIKGDDITNEGNRLFIKHGICPIPTSLECTQEPLQRGLKTTVKAKITCVNVDDTTDTVEFEAWGTGIDFSDKGVGKAYSYAVKYATAKALGLNTSDDIEEHDPEYERRPSDADVARETANVKQTKQAWASTYDAALKTAQSVAELAELKKMNRKELMSDDLPEVTRIYFDDLFDERKAEMSA